MVALQKGEVRVIELGKAELLLCDIGPQMRLALATTVSLRCFIGFCCIPDALAALVPTVLRLDEPGGKSCERRKRFVRRCVCWT